MATSGTEGIRNFGGEFGAGPSLLSHQQWLFLIYTLHLEG